ncbi:MAG: hypothetical protein AAGD28_01935 [Bacteroidota bacterium]
MKTKDYFSIRWLWICCILCPLFNSCATAYRSVYVEEKNVDHADWGLFLHAEVKQRPNMYFRCIVFEGEELSELSLFRVKEYEVGVATLKVSLEPSPDLSAIYHPEKGITQYDNLSKEMMQKLENGIIVHAYADLQSGQHEISYEDVFFIERFKGNGDRIITRNAMAAVIVPMTVLSIWAISKVLSFLSYF